MVRGNYIGTDATGTYAIGNTGAGIDVASSNGNTIGGTAAGAGNLVSGDGTFGVRVTGTSSGNAILGNQITANTSTGINLGGDGVTANDTGDADTGANDLQNFPVLTTARTNASSQISLDGTLNSSANSLDRIEFFANATADTSGNGEGQTYLGFANVATDGSGNATISTTLSVNVAAGSFISATATKATDGTYSSFTDTSEFAAEHGGYDRPRDDHHRQSRGLQREHRRDGDDRHLDGDRRGQHQPGQRHGHDLRRELPAAKTCWPSPITASITGSWNAATGTY